MKKNFWIVAALCFIAGRVAAQEVNVGKGALTFSGKIASGVFFDFDDVEKEDETGAVINPGYYGSDGRVYLWNDSDNKSPLRADLTANYIMDTVGFRIRLRANSALDGFDRSVLARYAYGWVNLFNQGLKFTGGFIDLSDNVWGTRGDLDKDIGGNGVRVELKPFRFFNLDESIAGSLNIGAFFLVPSQENPNSFVDGKPRLVTLERTFQETVFGFRYTHPWFYAGAQLRLDSDVDGIDIYKGTAPGSPGIEVWSGAADEIQFMFGAGFTMLPELAFTAEGIFDGMGNIEARGTADLRQTLSYSFEKIPVPWLDRLTLGVKAKELLWLHNLNDLIGIDQEMSPWMQIKPFINYRALNWLTIGIETGFGSGRLITGFDNNNKPAKFVNEQYNNYIKPNITANLKGGLSLKAWYMFNSIGYDNLWDSPAYADRRLSDIPLTKDNKLVETLIKQQIALEFIWTF